jgi:flagellar biosynthesis/type III secretory pathway chaperone
MVESMESLKECMVLEKQCYEGLFALSQHKKTALIENDMDKLNEIVKSENESMSKMKQLNIRSTDALQHVAQQLNIEAGANLTSVIAALKDKKQQRELENLQMDFKQLIADLSTQNQANQKLIKTHLEYNAFCIELITQNQFAGSTYGSEGYVNESGFGSKGLLDREV